MEHITKLRNIDAGEILCITGVKGCLGAGSFGVVQCVRHPSLGWIAVKCFPVDGGESARDLVIKQIRNELSVLQQANHENILRVYGWAQWEGAIAVVTELMRGGSLRLILADEDVPLHPVLRLRMCKEVSDGTAFIHNFSSTKRLTHGDLKPENILLTEDLRCKVGDFGGAKVANYTGQTTTTTAAAAADSKQQMTRVYAAPERLRKLSCRPKKEQDTYSIGLIFHGVLTRETPTEYSASVIEFIDGIKRGERPDTDAIDELKESLTNNAEKEIIQVLRSVMMRCWLDKPADRPDMRDVRDQLQQLMSKQKSGDVMRSVGEALDKMTIRIPERSRHQCLPLSCFNPQTKTFQDGEPREVGEIQNIESSNLSATIASTDDTSPADATGQPHERQRTSSSTASATMSSIAATLLSENSPAVNVDQLASTVEAAIISPEQKTLPDSIRQLQEKASTDSSTAAATISSATDVSTAGEPREDGEIQNIESSNHLATIASTDDTSRVGATGQHNDRESTSSSSATTTIFSSAAVSLSDSIRQLQEKASTDSSTAAATISSATDVSTADGVCDKCGIKHDSECCSFRRFVLPHYDIGPKIRDGAFGSKIYLCTRKGSEKNSKKFAAKVMNPAIYTVADEEIKVLENIYDFEHIVFYYGSHITSSEEKVIVFELCGGDMDQLIECLQKKRKSKSYEEFKPISQTSGTFLEIDFLKYFQISLIDIFRQTADGLKCLHDQSIVHRDMKPGNLLLYKRDDGTTIIKISDFGLSRKIPKDASTYLTDPAGTMSFTAPEYLVDQGKKITPTKAADIFTLGLCFYYIFTEGHHVYGDGEERYARMFKIRTGATPTFRHLLPYYDESSLMQSEAFNKDRHLTDEQRITACHLLRKMLQINPDKRPTIEDVKAHPTCWHGEDKKQMIVSLTSILENKHPKRKCHMRDIVDLDFEQFETSLIKDEESEIQVEMQARAFYPLQQDLKRERFHITAEEHLPECLRHRHEPCDDLRDLYCIARNMICYSLRQKPDVQKILKIEKDKEDWDNFLHEFFRAVPQHLINSHNFLEKHYPQTATEAPAMHPGNNDSRFTIFRNKHE